MARLIRAKINWTGFVGAPGYTVFHARQFAADPQAEVEAFRNALITFITGLRPNVPPVVSLALDSEFEIIEDSTGVLENVVTVASPASVAGTGLPGYTGPTGAVINWQTGQIRRGRRMRGRTFVVPMSSARFDVDGTLLPATRTQLQETAAALIATEGVQLAVYGRPTPGLEDGMNGEVTAASVPDLAAVLRSRRD